MMDYRREYEKWCSDAIFDKETKAELMAIDDENEIEDRFYKQLSFGTGGLRGIIGAGTNRMNNYTVGKASQGLANFINSQVKNGSVVIAYDSRHMSKEFALNAALIFAANGIKAYMFESLRPTPELSFAVRYLNATAGIVITASHNPPQYNGYKVYWSDGGQIVPPYDKMIISKVNDIIDYAEIKRIDENKATAAGLLTIIGKEIDDAYIAELKKLVLDLESIQKVADELKIVYTPLNGTGNFPVRRILSELGFNNVWVVPEQEQPDGRFPTLEYPNPEDKKAFTYALNLANKVGADIVLATDPDADRLGVYAFDKTSGEYMPFTGNMSGLLIAEYELSQKKRLGILPTNTRNGAIVTTIVSSKMAYAIAKEYGLTVVEVLTGFKYIGEQIKLFEDAKLANNGKLDYTKNAIEYEFGYEESYGCLVGTHSRDKDAIVAVMALCEAAAHYMVKGITLCDQMRNIYNKYGYYVEELKSITLEGVDGAERISNIMKKFRFTPPKLIGGERVIAVRDYLFDTRLDTVTDKITCTGLPKSDVLYYELENEGWCCVRPSGTEPKIKFYFGAKDKTLDSASAKLSRIKDDMIAMFS